MNHQQLKGVGTCLTVLISEDNKQAVCSILGAINVDLTELFRASPYLNRDYILMLKKAGNA